MIKLASISENASNTDLKALSIFFKNLNKKKKLMNKIDDSVINKIFKIKSIYVKLSYT
jgi:hypothetical protein